MKVHDHTPTIPHSPFPIPHSTYTTHHSHDHHNNHTYYNYHNDDKQLQMLDKTMWSSFLSPNSTPQASLVAACHCFPVETLLRLPLSIVLYHYITLQLQVNSFTLSVSVDDIRLSWATQARHYAGSFYSPLRPAAILEFGLIFPDSNDIQYIMNVTFPEGDPDFQVIRFWRSDGQVISVDIYSLDMFYQYNVRICINYGSQLGASAVLLVFLLLLTHSDKRSSFVFIFNGLALLFNILRLLFETIHFSTPFEKIYPFFSGDYSSVGPRAYAISILGTVFETMLVMCIMASLVVQVQVVCKTLRRRYRRPLLALSVLVALVPIGVRIGWMVINCMAIMALESTGPWAWLQSALNIVITTAICFFCAIFVTKLGHAIKQRRRLGVRDFGPMKIIFICGCQTMTIPALVSIIQYFSEVPELADNVLTLVTLSLPLSSIWAGAALENVQRIETPRSPRNLWRTLAFNMSRSMPKNRSGTEMTVTSYTGQTLCYADQQISKHSQDSEMPLAISVEHDISVDSVRPSGKNQSMV